MIESLLHTYGYAALVLILLLDSTGVPWPTEATLVVAGAAVGAQPVGVALLWAACVVGAALGSSLSYFLGQRMGAGVMRRIGAVFRLTPSHLDKVDQWFLKYGHRAVFFGRLVPFVRNFTGFPAGILGVPFGKYLLFSIAGYGLYCAFALTLGFGSATLARWFGDLEVVLWVLGPIAVIAVYLKWGRKWVRQWRGKG